MNFQLIRMPIKKQFILLVSLLLVISIAIVAHFIGGSLVFAMSYGILAILTWKLSKHFKKENILTTSLIYLFLVLSSACLTLFLLP